MNHSGEWDIFARLFKVVTELFEKRSTCDRTICAYAYIHTYTKTWHINLIRFIKMKTRSYQTILWIARECVVGSDVIIWLNFVFERKLNAKEIAEIYHCVIYIEITVSIFTLTVNVYLIHWYFYSTFFFVTL